MKLLNYLNKSKIPEDVNKFRAMDIKLVDKPTNNIKVVEKVSKKYGLDNSAIELLNSLNNELKKFYRGKYRFDFVLKGGKEVNEVKIKNSKIIKNKFFEFNSELALIKNKFEKKLREKEEK